MLYMLRMLRLTHGQSGGVETYGFRAWGVLVGVLACILLAGCRTQSVLLSSAHEKAFRERYIGKSFYTAMVVRPYELTDIYLIDLTGTIAQAAAETPRAALTIPLGTPIRVTTLTDSYLEARIDGFTRRFRILVQTKLGTLEAVTEELALLLADTPPLQSARFAMQPFILRQEVTHGMSQREVYMSWGQPDKIVSSPGASGFLEEWIYFDRKVHLFLRNGAITNWQQY